MKRSMQQWLALAKEQERRFWSHVHKTKTCWLWTAGLDKDGYGKFAVNAPRGEQKHFRAHRLSWFLVTGIYPTALLLHKCDVPRCCRPSHTFPGSQKQNREDCVRKIRHAFGDRHGMRKLTERQARAIIRARSLGVSAEVLALRYNIGVSTAYQVGTLYWKHLV